MQKKNDVILSFFISAIYFVDDKVHFSLFNPKWLNLPSEFPLVYLLFENLISLKTANQPKGQHCGINAINS